jgi:hypothetical protein
MGEAAGGSALPITHPASEALENLLSLGILPESFLTENKVRFNVIERA